MFSIIGSLQTTPCVCSVYLNKWNFLKTQLALPYCLSLWISKHFISWEFYKGTKIVLFFYFTRKKKESENEISNYHSLDFLNRYKISWKTASFSSNSMVTTSVQTQRDFTYIIKTCWKTRPLAALDRDVNPRKYSMRMS